MSGDIHFLLNQWRIWQLSKTGIPRYISPAYVMMRDNVEQMTDSSLDPLMIDDETALKVDRCIATMRSRSEHWYQCVKRHHGPAQQSMRSIAKDLHTHHQQIDQWLGQAKAWLEGRLMTLEEV